MKENRIIANGIKGMNSEKKIEEHKSIAFVKNQTEINRLVDCINSVLADNNIGEKITSDHVNFEPNAIGNNYIEPRNKKLTDIFFDHVFPKSNQKCFAHFTSINTAKSIVDSKSFWVFSLNKNSGAEYEKFYEDHNLLGYKKRKEFLNIETGYYENRKSLFSLSFTSSENNSDVMWEGFGKGYKGVKLYFNIVDDSDSFRKIRYSDSEEKIKLLADLSDAVSRDFNTTFRLYKISKAGAFYIKGSLDFEDEYRFIHDGINDAYKFKIKRHKDGQFYAKVPFENPIIKIQLTKIEKGIYCDPVEFEKLKTIVKKQYSYDIKVIEETR
jgi:hypothetical protein